MPTLRACEGFHKVWTGGRNTPSTPSHSIGERRRVYPPVGHLDTVDEHHRDEVGVCREQGRVLVDLAFLPLHPEFGADRRDDSSGVIAEVAARPSEQPDPGSAGRANRRHTAGTG